MTLEEIFSKLSSHTIRGMMIHEGMANYFDFLGLQGYKRCHEYHYFCESIENRKLQHFFINRYNSLIPEGKIDSSSVIPSSWLSHKRQDVDKSTKRNAVASAIEEWIKWEHETRKVLHEAYKELCDLSEVSAAQYVLEMISANDREIKKAEKTHLKLEAVDYDMVYITEHQDKIHKKYKEKMRELSVE